MHFNMIHTLAWSRTPKRSFFSFLMCFNLLKRKQQQRPREKEPSPTASTTTSTISSVVVPIEFTEKETALVEQPETSQQEPILGQEVEQQEQQEEAVNYLLDPIKKQHQGRKCLVLDLDETLIHSSFKVETKKYDIRTLKIALIGNHRLYLRQILSFLSKLMVITTTSLY